MSSEKKQESESGWQEKVYQYGFGLIGLGLVGLICPTFGLQLRQLRRLGEMQWVVLFAMVIIGCALVLWSRRDQIKVGLMITGGAVPVMLLFAYISFWRHGGNGEVAQHIQPNVAAHSMPAPASVPQTSPAPTPPDQPAESPATPVPAENQAPDAERNPPESDRNAPAPTPPPTRRPNHNPVKRPFLNARSTHLAGSNRGEPYQDTAPTGGVLIGMRCARGPNWGGALQALQPIYQVGSEVVLGKRHGKPGGDEVELRAKPGYAVGAIHANVGLVLNAVRLVFYRIRDQGLDSTDRYESEWAGSDGGGPHDMDAKGAPIAEIFGTYQDDIVSLGIKPGDISTNVAAVVAGTSPAPPAVEPATPPAPASQASQPATNSITETSSSKSTAPEFRKWTSSDGKSTVEAKMLGKNQDSVQLERRDQKVITVPFSKLSAADVEYVRSQQ